MVSTSSPLAVAAGLWALDEGGSAVDAAVAADAVLGVTQPLWTGIGGDAFALVADGGEVVALDDDGGRGVGHGWAPTAGRPVSARTISCFCTFPDAVVGSASRISRDSGSL